MQQKDTQIIFDAERAAAYDKRFEKLAAMKDALHLCMRMVLTDLPEDARVLCVGAGTGAELLYLADAFPAWTFTLVEPAAPMLDLCRHKAEVAGITPRCTFHEGYLDTLPKTAPFDVATSLLVSQFVLNRQKRCDFFQDIAARLRPNGHLITADLCTDMNTPGGASLFDTWIQVMQYNGLQEEELANYRIAMKENVAVIPTHEVEDIITSSGFDAPVLFCQTLLIHAWYTRRAG